MKKLSALLFLALGTSAWGSQVVTMVFVSGTNPGFFDFKINGVDFQLLCDQFSPNVTTQPYTATEYSLSELAGATGLALFGDPQELLKYQRVALLDLQAYANPSLAPDVVRANRIIVDGSGPHTPGADALLALVATLNPANFPQLSSFLIFAGPRTLAGDPITQEITGFIPPPTGDTGGGGNGTPEPGTMILLGAGLAGIVIKRRRQSSAKA